MELILKTAEVSIPQTIENLEQLKAEIAPKIAYYKSLVVTEDGIKAAKADKADLNRLKKAIDEQRIAVKKQCLAPYNALEKQCKELEALIIAPIAAIDTQIKAFEEAEKQAKYTELQEHFDSVNETEWIRLEDVLNPKWANKSEKLDSLKSEIAEGINRIIGDYSKIAQMYANFPHLLAIQDKFRQTKDFSVTMVYAKNLEWEWQKEQKAKQRESTQNAPETAPNADGEVIQKIEQRGAECDPELLLSGTFRVACTKSQLISLRDFMKAQGIKFEIIK